MNDRSRDHWRKKKLHKDTREPAVTRSWQAGQRRTQSATSGSRWSFRKHLKTAGAATLLIAIVAFTIYIFMPGTPVLTHVIVFDLCKKLDHFGVTSEAPNFGSRERGSFEWGAVTVENPDPPGSFEFTSDASDDRDKADVFVVYLHANIVAGDQDQYWCLVRNSTPDLENNQYVRLAILKDKISLLRKAGIPVVLIVDQPAGRLDWRLGALKTQVNTELEKWTNEESTNDLGEKRELGRLFVVSSSLHTESSAPGRNRQTAFGIIVSRAWSQAANVTNEDDGGRRWLQKKNNFLTIAEFCDYVKSETHDWVSKYRRPSGQTVEIFGSSAEVKTDSLKLLGTPQEDPLLPKQTSIDATALTTVWNTQQELDSATPWRWAPQRWQSANEYLRGAQNALLDGNTRLADELTGKAEKSLRRLTEQAKTELGSPVDSPTEMPHCWFTGLPARHRLDDLWKTVGKKAPKQTTIEDVLAGNVNEYPFGDLGIVGTESAKQDKDRITQVLKTNRTNAEGAVAQLLSVTGLLRPATLAAEQKLLSQEDRVFIEQKTNSGSTDDWTVIQEFAKAHQEAELAFQRTLSQSESLARWAASQPINPDLQPDLVSNLVNNLKTDCDTTLAEKPLKNNKDLPLQLQSEISRLLITARMTGTLLWPDTTDQIDSLAKQTTTLVSWTKKLRLSQSNVSRLLGQLVKNLKTPVTNALGYAANHQELRAILDVAPMSSNDRTTLIANLSLPEPKDSDFDNLPPPDDLHSDGVTKTASEQAAGTTETPPPHNALWQLQHLSLFRLGERQGNKKAAEHLSLAANTIAEKFAAAEVELIKTGVVLDDANLAKFGKAIRSFWKESRKAIGRLPNAGTSIDDLTAQSRRDDLISRGLSAYDVGKVQSNPTQALHALWQIDYCLLHAERLLMGQWVEPAAKKEAAPWYQNQTTDWITAAKSRANESLALKQWPTNVKEQIAFIENKLIDSRNKWSLSAKPSKQYIAISDGEKHDVVVKLAVEGTLPEHLGGAAALQYLPTVRAQNATEGTADLIKLDYKVQAFELPVTDPKKQTKQNKLSYNGEPKKATDGCENIDFTTGVFFRGRNWPAQGSSAAKASRLTVNWCTPASFLVTRNKRPSNTSVWLSGIDKRKIVFVLDMSLSMDKDVPTDGKSTGTSSKRYQEAIAKLKSLINDLDDQTEVTLFVFGHRSKNRKNSKGQFKIVYNSKYKVHFEPQPGQDWERNPLDDVEKVFPIDSRMREELGHGGRNRLLTELDKIRKTGPYGITPMALASIDAIDTFDEKEHGVVVVITDGIALDVGLDINGNGYSEEQLEKFPERDRTSALKKVVDEHTHVSTMIIALDLPDTEQKALNDVFMNKEKVGFDKLITSTTTGLKKAIQEALLPREYTVTGDREWPQKFGDPIEKLVPGNEYEINYLSVKATKLNLSPGDKLDVSVDWNKGGGKFKFTRKFLGTGDGRIRIPVNGMGLEDPLHPKLIGQANSILEEADQKRENFLLKLMLDHSDKFRSVRQPAEIEFQLLPSDLRPEQWPIEITETFTGEMGAPGYRIEVRGWLKEPTPLPRIRAIWKMERTQPHPKNIFPLPDSPNPNFSCTLSADTGETMPTGQVTCKLLGKELQVRLDPDPKPPSRDMNFSDYDPDDVRHVRVELGNTDVDNDVTTFKPMDVTTTIKFSEDGHVTFKFFLPPRADKEALSFKGMKLGFTSFQSRREGAYRVDRQLKPEDVNEEAVVTD